MKNLCNGSRIASILMTASLVGPLSAAATTAVAPMPLELLAEVAELSVHGTVESIDSYVDGDRIFTEVVLRIIDVLKGRTDAETVTVKLYGGVAAGKITRVFGGPCFSDDEEVVVFLRPNGPTTWGVVNLAEGKLRVLRDVPGAPQVTRDLREITYLTPPVRTDVPESLAELKAQTREVGK
jgi:hypothetical protein